MKPIVVIGVSILTGFIIGRIEQPYTLQKIATVTHTPIVAPISIVDKTNEDRVRLTIEQVEKLIQKRNGVGVMQWFTPPETKEEASEYAFLMGIDLIPGQPVTPRLLSTANYFRHANSYTVNSLKKQEDFYIADVAEVGKAYNNAASSKDGLWTPYTADKVFIITQIGANYMVSKYYPKGANPTKYGFN